MASDELRLSCGCVLIPAVPDLVIRPCCEAHADRLILQAIEHGCGAAGIEYRRRNDA